MDGQTGNTVGEEMNSGHIDGLDIVRRSDVKTPPGILRVDVGSIRRASSDLKYLLQIEPTSPQPSVDRLSVTFADDSVKSDKFDVSMDKVRFPSHTDDENSDDDYSASVTAIFQRRASTRKSKKRGRRGSSPFSPDILPDMENGRRISSVTISSGDTAITMDDSIPSATQEQIFENIKLHKEVLSSVKMQPWNMRKKIKLVMQAKTYIKKHEGALQERLAQSHSTKDMLARCNIYLVKKWHQCKREAANMSNWLIPWELRIKEIESHFGSVVASYFIFLRWLFWVNMVISAILILFVAVPEMLTADFTKDPERKSILPEDKYNSTNFLTLWDFEGVFKYSPMFYGWYTNRDAQKGYRLPLAYFCTGLAVYIYSFVATLRKMAKNSRMSKLSEKDDECTFSWKLFTGWDYMIGNAETAHNRVASIVMGFKEALLEEAEKKREAQNWKIIGARILVNIGVLLLLALSAFAVVTVVARSNEKEANSTTWRRNEITVVMSLISLFFPILFELLGYFEHYHPRKQLRLQLARIMVLNLLNLYSLMFALFGKINDMTTHLQSIRPNATENPLDIATTTLITKLTTSQIINSEMNYTNCNITCNNDLVVSDLISTLIDNVTKTILPDIYNNLTYTTDNPVSTGINYSYLLKNDSEFNEYATDGYNNLTIKEFIQNVTKDIENDFTTFIGEIENFFSILLEPENSTNFNLDFNNTRDLFISTVAPILNTTEEQIENFFSTLLEHENSTNFNNTRDLFISTVAPILNTTEKLYSTTFNSIFDQISTTMNTLQINSTTPQCRTYCDVETHELTTNNNTKVKLRSDYKDRRRLRSLCWETMFGQELVKLTVMDLVLTLLSTLAIDFFRGIFVRFMNNCWCWDLEKRFPQYGDFKVAENILHLVNNQGMVWMGMFFSPGLVVLNLVKLHIMMYLRSWAVLTCNVPHEVIFRASRSNNFYFALLLVMLFLSVLPVGYTIVWLDPSWHCGPFSSLPKIFHIFTITVKNVLPPSTHNILDYLVSPGIVIPLLVLLILIIYYLVSLTNSLREANNDLKFQLKRERTEERRKVFQLADKRRRGGSAGSGELNTPFGKWKKLMLEHPGGKSFDDTRQESVDIIHEEKNKTEQGNKILSKLLLRKMIKNRKRSDISEDDSVHNVEDGTDTEQHDSLPDDVNSIKDAKPQTSKKMQKPIQRPTTLENIRNTSIDSNETKHVKIKDIKVFRSSKEKPIIDSRKDSINSVWSDNIPVITISKTESSECILESKTVEISSNVELPKETKIKVDIEKNEEMKSPKNRYVLKKQVPIAEKDDDIIKEVDKSVAGKEAQNIFKQSTNGNGSTQTTDTTKTESSTDYKDSIFSN